MTSSSMMEMGSSPVRRGTVTWTTGKSGGHSSSPGQGHARTARALSTPPSGARLPSDMNPTAASHSRTPQSAKLTMCANMDSARRMISKRRQGGSYRSRKANPSRVSSSPRWSTASSVRMERRKTTIHASTPRSAATAACQSIALPSP